jgi:predicted SnoaL-like aldol condensation-catalyzing enzyme
MIATGDRAAVVSGPHQRAAAACPARASREEATMSEAAVTTQTHKEAAQDFLRLVASGKVREAYDRYIGPEFRHHNAYFKSDAESLRTAMEENAAKTPHKVLTVHRALQDGDLVAVHSHIRQTPEDRGAAVVHVFRFQGDRIAEMWDVGQAVPESSPNELGIF